MKKKGIWYALLAVLLTAAVVLVPVLQASLTEKKPPETSDVEKSSQNIIPKKEDKPASQKDDSSDLKDGMENFLIVLTEDAMLDMAMSADSRYESVRELLLSDEGKSRADAVRKSQAVAKASITKLVPQADFDGSRTLSALMNAMTVKAPKSAAEKLGRINGVSAVYELTEEYVFFDIEDGTEESVLYEYGEDALTDETEASDSEESGDRLRIFGEIELEPAFSAQRSEVADINDETEENSGTQEDTNSEVSTETDETAETSDDGAENVRYPVGNALQKAYRDRMELIQESGEENGGQEMMIAVLDSEFDVNEQVFSQEPEMTSVSREMLKTMSGIIRFGSPANISGDACYVSQKIPFAFDYAENDTNTYDPSLLHGTLTAAVAAGNNGREDANAFSGAAKDAQLALMKIADSRRDDGRIAVRTDALLCALDDSVKLGADVICMSFGSYELTGDRTLFQNALQKLYRAGVAVVCAAGNAGYNGMQQGNTLYTEDIFYGTENVLSSQSGVLTAGSAQNGMHLRRFITINGQKLYYQDLNLVPLTDTLRFLESPGTLLSDEIQIQFNEYTYLEEYTAQTYLRETDIKDKLVIADVVSDELIPELCSAAQQKGAVGVALLNELGADRAKVLSKLPAQFPVIWIETPASFFSDMPNGTYLMDTEDEVQEIAAPSVSSFTSYGVSDRLVLNKRMLAIGEDVYTGIADSSRAVMNGTSASAPAIAGAAALVKSRLKDQALSPSEWMKTTEELLLSAAEPITAGRQNGETLYASPRVQGFGLMQLQKALSAKAVFQTGEELQGLSLGESEDGRFELSFSVRNLSEQTQNYHVSCVVQTDTADGRINTLKPLSLTKHTSVSFEAAELKNGTLTIESGKSAEISGILQVEEKTLSELKKDFPKGCYLEGFIFLTPTEEGSALSLPFMGFYGSVQQFSPFDHTVYDNETSVTGLESTLMSVAYRSGAYASCTLLQGEDSILFSRDALRTVLDDSSCGVSFILPNFYTLRNVYDLTVSILDEQGKVLYSECLGDVSSFRVPDKQPFEKLTHGNKGLREQFLKMSNGKYKYEVSAKTMLPNGTLSSPFTAAYWFTLDETKPSLLSAETFRENGKTYLELTAKGLGGIQKFELYAAAYNSKNNSYRYIDSLDKMISAGLLSDGCYTLLEHEKNKDGTDTFRYDITDLHRQLSTLSVSTETWSANSSDKKIACKAIDCAFNASAVQTADVIIYGTALFRFKDTNGDPAKGVSVTIGKKTVVSDKNGEAIFEGLEPDFYYASLSCSPSDYALPSGGYIVTISEDRPLYEQSLTLKAFRTYVPEPDDAQADDQTAQQTVQQAETEPPDEPFYALAFVTVLLAICITGFLFRKNLTR